jgi:Ca2+-binding RTX toxin-like protein
VLGSDTLVRFVPAQGFSGTPGGLEVHGLDDTYADAVTADSPVWIDITSAGTGSGGTTPVSEQSASIGTEVIRSDARGPVIDTESFFVEHIRENGTDSITGLHVVDNDAGASPETFSVSVATQFSGSSVTPETSDGELDDINLVLDNGIIYDPIGKQHDTQNPSLPQTDQITITVADSFGHSDTVNFIFNEYGESEGLTLEGTEGKDVIFATEACDTLIGNGGKDQFVFQPTWSEHAVQHTVSDFQTGLDRIDLRLFDIGSWDDVGKTQQGDDTLLTLDHNGHDTVLLKNVIAGNLSAGDFIVSHNVIT